VLHVNVHDAPLANVAASAQAESRAPLVGALRLVTVQVLAMQPWKVNVPPADTHDAPGVAGVYPVSQVTVHAEVAIAPLDVSQSVTS